jgi:probable HAF family extracellular repeat protein
MTDLGAPGGDSSSALAINERGQVLLVSAAPASVYHNFLWETGTLTDLGTPGGGFSYASALNERGQVVGYGDIGSGEVHAVLWTK